MQVNGVDVTADEVLAFGTFNAKLSRTQTSFVLSGTFTPGESSDGVQQPLDEAVTLSLGSYALLLPLSQSPGGSFGFTGDVDGVTLTVQLKRLKRGAWELTATAESVVLTSPVQVGLRIGDDLAFKTVKVR